MKLLIFVNIELETSVIHQNKAEFMQKFTSSQKNCFSLEKVDFLRGGEISPPLGPWCIKNTSGPEGLIVRYLCYDYEKG